MMSRETVFAMAALLILGCATARTNSILELDNGTRLMYVASPGAMEPNAGGCVVVVSTYDPVPDLTNLTIIGFLEARIPEQHRKSVEDTGVDEALATRALNLGARWAIVLDERTDGDVVVQRAILAVGQEATHTGRGFEMCGQAAP